MLWLEALGAALGIAGALMLALKTRISKWAWPLWTISCAAALYIFIHKGLYFFAIQQAAFMVANLIGCWQWIVKPYRTSKRVAGPDDEVLRCASQSRQAGSLWQPKARLSLSGERQSSGEGGVSVIPHRAAGSKSWG